MTFFVVVYRFIGFGENYDFRFTIYAHFFKVNLDDICGLSHSESIELKKAIEKIVLTSQD